MDRDADLAGIDLKLLVVLDVLLAERSISAAAQRLSCGQPAVSKKLAALRTLRESLWRVPSVALVMGEILPVSVYPTPVDLGLGYVRQLWHERTHHDPMHSWLRQPLFETGQEVAARVERAEL